MNQLDYGQLRAELFARKPIATDSGIYGIINDISYPEGLITLGIFADRSNYLYFEQGGGIIGSKEFGQINAAIDRLMPALADFLPLMEPTETTFLPDKGYATFYLLMEQGIYGASEPQDADNEGSPFTPLVELIQPVVREIKLVALYKD